MTTAIMQPYLFPYIGYFQLLEVADTFVLYDDVAFINKGWINRNQLLSNGMASMFTVPLKYASQNKLIYEIEIDTTQKWQEKLLKTIQQNYRKAPYFEPVYGIVRNLLENTPSHISVLIAESIEAIVKYLEFNIKIILSSEHFSNQHLSGQARIIDICKNLSASRYVNAIGGMELYDKKDFQTENIELKFQKTNPISYQQFGATFVSNLSILDVLFFNDPATVKSYLTSYKLV